MFLSGVGFRFRTGPVFIYWKGNAGTEKKITPQSFVPHQINKQLTLKFMTALQLFCWRLFWKWKDEPRLHCHLVVMLSSSQNKIQSSPVLNFDLLGGFVLFFLMCIFAVSSMTSVILRMIYVTKCLADS